MFEGISQKIVDVFARLGRDGTLTEAHIEAGLREIRVALLEADVSLAVVKDFVNQVKERALGANILKSISPQQTLIKIVHDYLVEILCGGSINGLTSSQDIRYNAKARRVMLVGLQGAGKTTTAGKLACMLKEKHQRKVLLCSLDVYRPAAYDQLRKLAEIVGCDFFAWPGYGGDADMVDGASRERFDPLSIANAALNVSSQYDTVIFDTAGRLQIDEMKMDELKQLSALISPNEMLLTCDVMLGQEAYNVARKFSADVPLTGIVLTRADSDARGGVALSMRFVTGCMIKFLGVGEKLDALELFDARRVADRMLGMGDVVSLVEKAQAAFSEDEAQKMSQTMFSGKMTLADLEEYFVKISQMGSMSSLMKMIPGMSSLSGKGGGGVDDNLIKKHIAILRSMTKKEKQDERIIDGSRRRRIASGSGTSVQDVNGLLRQHQAIVQVMKRLKGMGGMKSMMSMMMKGRV